MMRDSQQDFPKIIALGEAAWTVELDAGADIAVQQRIAGLAAMVEEARAAGGIEPVSELVPTLRALTVYFDPQETDALVLREQLAVFAKQAPQRQNSGRRWRIPICFDDVFAPDLGALAAENHIAANLLIEKLTATVLHVGMLGFQPGFAYLTGLDPQIRAARLAVPRTRAPARSLAVITGMAAIYPFDSPGGWRLVGRTPIPLFDIENEKSPALFQAGDTITLVSTPLGEFSRIEASWMSGASPTAELWHGLMAP